MGNRPAFRRYELEKVAPHIPPRARILEIGGGSGLQAKMLQTWGHEVESIDIEVPDDPEFPVRVYDGLRIPFDDRSFDVIFSSNVLEHVPDVPALLRETARVLKPRGRAIHVMPSATWRLLTIASHYVHLLQRGLAGVAGKDTRDGSTGPQEKVRRSVFTSLVPGPHGEFSSAASEVLRFQKRAWNKAFRQSGFAVKETFGSGIAYSGYDVAPWLPIRAREVLSRIVGSSCNVFVVEVKG
ncbi:MAG: hypothetical protein QOG04_968 [Actinomycetota bacterium]|jgi:SAM-dependent methyltransferase|nr:hypothetical protein [Actinomycetota bacterium]